MATAGSARKEAMCFAGEVVRTSGTWRWRDDAFLPGMASPLWQELYSAEGYTRVRRAVVCECRGVGA